MQLFIPFLFLHISSLLRLSGITSIWSVMCCGYRKASRSVSISGAISLSSSSQINGDAQRSAPQLPTMRAPSGKGDHDAYRRHVQRNRRGAAASQAIGLLWSSSLIYAASAAYCGLAIYAAATTLKDPVFWVRPFPPCYPLADQSLDLQKVQILYGSGIYGVVGLVVHLVLIYRAVTTIRAKRSSLAPRNHAATIGSLGIRRGFAYSGAERPTTLSLDPCGIRVDTRTEICTDLGITQEHSCKDADEVSADDVIASLPTVYMPHSGRRQSPNARLGG